MAGLAATAGSGNFRFPVGFLLIKPADKSAALGNRRPRFGRSRDPRNTAAAGKRDGATLRRFAFSHSETAGLFRGRTGFINGLRVR